MSANPPNVAKPNEPKHPPFQTIEHFLFETPLYEALAISRENLLGLMTTYFKVDGYCPHCSQSRTFKVDRNQSSIGHWQAFDFIGDTSIVRIGIKCTRHEEHELTFYALIAEGTIQKVGQIPSFADIAIDESKSYSDLLNKEDRAEFHKAIGLAAHGVGIGSFVYIRRIFERLIQSRFDEFKAEEGWNEEEYKKLRMAERIQFMKTHLPEFLVRNSKLYSILSLGVHELDEQTCLDFFSVLKTSTIVILEEDKKKKEERARQQGAEKAIATFEARNKTGQVKGHSL